MVLVRWNGLFVALSVAAVAMSGCLTDSPGPTEAEATGPRMVTFRVVDASSDAPIFLAQIAVVNGTDALVVVSTAKNGTAPVAVPSEATGWRAGASGYLPARGSIPTGNSVITIALEPLQNQFNETTDEPRLTFRAPVDLGSREYPVAVGTSCNPAGEGSDGDCGLGEPQVEVDALGQIYVSGVCCIGNAPPVYVSRDDGYTFEELTTPIGVREAFGIEGDFAVDADGVVYFADIELAATFQVTAWDHEGNYIHHTKWPAPPLVDRDWIRADGSGHLYYVYNTGADTNVYTSTDGGQTWSPTPAHSTGYGLGMAIKGVEDGELWVVGGNCGDGTRCADVTRDGGASWEQETTTAPIGSSFPSGYMDEAGHVYVAQAVDEAITVARRDADGTWQQPVTVSPEGHHRMPWLAAAGPGKVAVAWYGTLDDEVDEDTRWHLFVAASLNADEDKNASWQSAIADPEPVFHGVLGRDLLDFLQVEIGPEGAIHVAYSKVRAETGGEEQLHYVHSVPNLPLKASDYFWGP